MRFLITYLFILLVATSSFAQRSKSALLPASEAKALTNQCSRDSPSDFSDTWEPSSKDIVKMESTLSKISSLTAKSCCIEGSTVEHPDDWYLQYVGIVRNGKKLIYISAISPERPAMHSAQIIDGITKDIEGPDIYWKKHALTV